MKVETLIIVVMVSATVSIAVNELFWRIVYGDSFVGATYKIIHPGKDPLE